MKRIIFSIVISFTMLLGMSVNCSASGGVTISRDTLEIKDHEYDGKTTLEFVNVSSCQNPYYYYYISGIAYVPETDYWLHSKMERIGNYALYNTGLHSFEIDVNVKEIGEFAIGWRDGDTNPEQVEGFKIYGERGTLAEKYAKENNFIFVDCYDVHNTPYSEEYRTFVPGDYNADGQVSIEDAQICLKSYVDALAGFTNPYSVTVASDVNNDDAIDVQDAQLILKYYIANSVAGNYTSWFTIRNKLA